MAHKKKILVLMGGPSSEHEVSLESGKNVAAALTKRYRVASSSIPKKGNFAEYIMRSVRTHQPDVVFIAMHGEYGEDGRMQAMLENMGVAYTGPGVLASALAMDKIRSSELFSFHNLTIPQYRAFHKKDLRKETEHTILRVVGLPLVIKPSDRGSSVGISIVRKKEELPTAVTDAFRYSDSVMAQKYIDGIEVTCGVLEDPKTHEAFSLIPTQIMPQIGEFYSYKAKYTEGGTKKLTPPQLPKSVIKKIQQIALQAHTILGCKGMSRTDMIVAGKDIYILEVNTIPGMTSESLLPRGAKALGIDFPALLGMIVQSALHKN